VSGGSCHVSVVVPVHANADTVAALQERLRTVLDQAGLRHETVFVDDASPDESLAALWALAARDRGVRVLSLTRNRGQHRAVLAGLRLARGERVAIMDADLQDPPEALPALLERLGAGYDAAFAGRRGRYESHARLLTSRLFKTLLHLAAGVPADAGMYVVITRQLALALAAAETRAPFVVAMIGAAARRTCSVPVVRDRRPCGRSAYSGWDRLRIGTAALAGALAGRLRSAAR
jgi:polyisoprenyl-phosphate glycosyltransferase